MACKLGLICFDECPRRSAHTDSAEASRAEEFDIFLKSFFWGFVSVVSKNYICFVEFF